MLDQDAIAFYGLNNVGKDSKNQNKQSNSQVKYIDRFDSRGKKMNLK